MELRVLRYFLAVAREENISRAAEALHVTQPTLSRQLADLEDELGVTLFYRGNRRITLSDAGLLLRRRAEEVLSLVDKIVEEMHVNEGPIEGTVAIGSAEAAGVQVFPPLLREFSTKYPHVHYEMFTGNAETVTERIDKGLLDVGLLTEPVDVSRYEYVRLPMKDRWGVLMPTNAPLAEKETITPNDLHDVPMMIPRRPEVQKDLMRWFGGDDMRIFAVYNLITNARTLVADGLGYAFGLDMSPQADPTICFRPLEPELCSTSVLVWKKYQPVSEAVRRFIHELRIRFGNS